MGSGFESRQVQGIFLLFKRPHHFCGLPTLVSGYRNSFAGVKRPGRDVNHSRPSSAEAKYEWSYTSTLFNIFVII